MQRGDVYWVDFGPPAGVRPAVVVTRTSALERLTSVTVGPMTTRTRKVRSWVLVTNATGLPEASCINLDALQSVYRSQLLDFICHLPEATMDEVSAAIRFALALDAPPPLY